jgi:hypothetical protein
MFSALGVELCFANLGSNFIFEIWKIGVILTSKNSLSDRCENLLTLYQIS